MKPKHLFYSFLGHIVVIFLMGFTATALRPDTPPPPGTIRVNFGELPRPGRPIESAQDEPEADPIPEAPPEAEPVVEETPPSPTPAPEPAARQPETEEAPEPERAPQPEAAEPVKPVARDEAEASTELPPELPPVTEEEPSPGPSADEAGEVTPGTETPAAPAAPRQGAEEGKGASVQARGEVGAGDAYLGLVQSKIGRRWQPNAASTAGRPALETVVSFRIGARGQVLEPEIFQASGLSVFDRQALRAVLESDPLPPPPARFRVRGLNIQFTFTYRR